MPSSSPPRRSPPYAPTTASLGGAPTKGVDIPISAVFLVLFLLAAAAHMTILQLNLRKGHKFLISGLCFGFCMARSVAQILRIAFSCHPHNIRLAIAANVFVQAGVVLLFVVNLIFAQRIVRAAHPHSGWHPIIHWAFITIYALIVVTLIMIITTVIQSFYTLNKNTKRIDRDIQLYGQTLYAIIAFLPILLVIGGLIIPRHTRVEKFGQGHWRVKIIILITSTLLLTLGATFKVGVNYAGGKRPITDPASYQGKACFYVFNYVVEYIVVLGYVLVRVDKRFWVPDASHHQGDYLRKEEDMLAAKKGGVGGKGGKGGKAAKVLGEEDGGQVKKAKTIERIFSTEEEVFDDMTKEEVHGLPTRREKDVEAGDAAAVL